MITYTLRQLEFARAVARDGGIAQAARRLGISPPAISAAIDKLEDLIGLKLFDRFPAAGLRLTGAGAQFLENAHALLMQAEALDQHARALASQTRGHIRFGCYLPFASLFAPLILQRHNNDWPLISIDVLEDRFAGLNDALLSNQVDMVLAYDQGFSHASFDVIPLRRIAPKVILPQSHPLAFKPVLTLADLAGIPYVRAQEPGPGPSFLDGLNALGLFPEIAMTCRSYELVRSCVGKGMGFTLTAFQPSNPLTYHGDPIVAVPLEAELPPLTIVAVRPRGSLESPILGRFIEICAQIIAAA